MAQWKSTQLKITELLAQASMEAQCCSLEQETLSSAYIVLLQPRKCPEITDRKVVNLDHR